MANFDTIKTAIDANINTNGNQAITGGKMNSILHQMIDATDEQLTELESIPIDLSGYFLNSNIGQLTAFIEDNGLKSCKFPVTEGFVVEVKGRGSNAARLWATLDAYGRVVRCADFIDAHHSEEVVIERGESSLIYSSYATGELYVKLKYPAKSIILNTKQAAIHNAQLVSKVNEIQTKTESINLDLNGYYLNANIGQLAIFIEDAGLKSCKFAVVEGEVVEVKGRGSNTARLWATLDKNGVVVRCADFIDAHHSEEVVIERGESSLIYSSYSTGDLYVRIKSSIADFFSKKTLSITEQIDEYESRNTSIIHLDAEFIQGQSFNVSIPIGEDVRYIYVILQTDEELNSLFLQLNFDNSEVTYIQPNTPFLFNVNKVNNLSIARDGSGITLSGKARVVVAYNLSAVTLRAMKAPIFVDTSRFEEGYLFSNGEVMEDVNYLTSPYIPVRKNDIVEISHLYTSNYGTIFLYGDRHNLLGIESTLNMSTMVENYQIHIREDKVRYIRFTCLRGQIGQTIVQYGNVPTPNDAFQLIQEQQENYNKACFGKNNKLFGSANDTPIVTIIDDDTVSSVEVTRFYNACKNKGIKGTYAVLTNTWETDEELKDLLLQYERNGFGMALHSYSQTDAYLRQDLEVAGADLIRGMQDMQAAGFIDYRNWVTPYGVSDEIWRSLAVKVGLNCLVSIGQNAIETSDYINGRFGLMRPNLNPDSDVDTIKNYIDTCVKSNGWLLLGTHIYDWTDEQIEMVFNAVIDYAIEKGCKFMTLGEALRKRMPIYNYYETYYK